MWRRSRPLDVADDGALGAGQRLLAALGKLAQGVGNLSLVGLAPGGVGDSRAGRLGLLDGFTGRCWKVSLDKAGGRGEERGRLGDEARVRGGRRALVELVGQVRERLLRNQEERDKVSTRPCSAAGEVHAR